MPLAAGRRTNRVLSTPEPVKAGGGLHVSSQAEGALKTIDREAGWFSAARDLSVTAVTSAACAAVGHPSAVALSRFLAQEPGAGLDILEVM